MIYQDHANTNAEGKITEKFEYERLQYERQCQKMLAFKMSLQWILPVQMDEIPAVHQTPHTYTTKQGEGARDCPTVTLSSDSIPTILLSVLSLDMIISSKRQ